MRQLLENAGEALMCGATLLYFAVGSIAMCVPTLWTMVIG
jgi:hypothetical protein